jgi:hypothetical protein
MRTILSALAGATLLAGTAMADESWTSIPTASGPLMTGTVVADRGGDSAPVFAGGTSRYDAVAAADNVVIVAGGDSYDVIPRAFMGGRDAAPAMVAVADARTGRR